ncbi:nose resistant to fluoxetine protein 6 [Elysia marginata]|uniref:Nose resistant to fluoxetine protein 6 n=1 Tax=Elysia marginata TaxID=1093978 RepID=A0AAV4FMJ2_9GAST|nr:nose resistant to fluoxetine protein 6 [Elysia marginata]
MNCFDPLFAPISQISRNRRLGTALIVCLLVLGMISAFVSELTYGGQFLLMDMNFSDYWSHVYTVPWARVSAFAIGLLLGVILRDLDKKPQAWETLLARKWCQRLFTPMMWTLNIGVGICLAMMNHVQWRHGSGHWDKPSLAVFESLSRPLWSLAVAWVIFACNTGRAGPIAKLLSFPPFVILSRLSYSVYLLHPLIILFVIYSRRTGIYLPPDRLDQVYNYLGHLVLTHLVAVVLYLFVEAPLRSLDILWEPRRRRKVTQ